MKKPVFKQLFFTWIILGLAQCLCRSGENAIIDRSSHNFSLTHRYLDHPTLPHQWSIRPLKPNPTGLLAHPGLAQLYPQTAGDGVGPDLEIV